MEASIRVPGFTAEASLKENTKHFGGSVVPAQACAQAVVPQVWCEGPLGLGQRCCEMWGGDLVCYTIGKQIEM